MEREHTRSDDSQQAFEATNYGTKTTSEIEVWSITYPKSVT